jgi:hypothetical protein
VRLLWWRDKAPSFGTIRILRLEPGDTVVLTIPEALGPRRAEEIDAILKEQFPGHKVLVLHGGWDLAVIKQHEREMILGETVLG